MNNYKIWKNIISTYLPGNIIYSVRDSMLNWKYLLAYSFNKKWFDKAFESVMLRPIRIGIETSNYCNANCVFCAYQHQTRKKEVMSIELYKKLMKDYALMGGGPIELTPIVGDSLIDEYFLERIDIASTFSEIDDIIFYTNAIILDKFDINRILRSGVRQISISTTGFDKDMY